MLRAKWEENRLRRHVRRHDPLIVRVNGSDWRKGANYVKMVVGYSLLVEVSVHVGILTIADN